MELMDWAVLLGSVGEFVGAIAVVVTLVILMLQVRHSAQALKESNRLARAQTAQARVDLGVEILMSRYTSDILDTLDKARDDPRALTRAENTRLGHMFNAQMRIAENMYYQQREGFLDEFWAEQVPALTRVVFQMGDEVGSKWWAEHQRLFSTEFRDYVSRLAAGGSAE